MTILNPTEGACMTATPPGVDELDTSELEVSALDAELDAELSVRLDADVEGSVVDEVEVLHNEPGPDVLPQVEAPAHDVPGTRPAQPLGSHQTNGTRAD
ncbi:hypothetical protein [Actinosynnema sp. NPDC020468]|uniref:hypothetical protein n=1 Tax=Actinosynnema sp. NPDC020468 TaxID=3154488 RepID=UPI003410D9A1